jgi:phage shock protein PspC (stress-responsive transcriptional regulator)
MNRVITINLNGVAYQLEESGYEQLRAYLDHAARRLEGNPDKDEILADIEQAIADKFRALLGTHKTVVVTREVADVITQMGPVQDASGTAPDAAADAAGAKPAGQAQAASDAGTSRPPRRLYKISDGAMLAGVCNGLSAYFNIDVSFIRVGFALLTVFWGTGLLVYLILAFILPEANTPAEKAAASGAAATAEEFIRRAKAGYYEGMKHFNDRQAHREWKRKFRQEMRGWKYGFRRQMRENATQWQQNWAQPGWGSPIDRCASMGLTLTVLRLIRLACFAVAFYAVYSLITHHAVFGFGLPVDVPVWIGVVAVCIAYQFVVWPLKMMRYAACGPRWGWGGYAGPLDGIMGIVFLIAMVWVADHYSPTFHAWLLELPPALHRFLDQVQAWWARR